MNSFLETGQISEKKGTSSTSEGFLTFRPADCPSSEYLIYIYIYITCYKTTTRISERRKKKMGAGTQPVPVLSHGRHLIHSQNMSFAHLMVNVLCPSTTTCVVDETNRAKTASITPDGVYQFKVMPFGPRNAPATYKRMMDSLLQGFKWSTCLCYLDDVIVFSPSFTVHVEHLSKIIALF